MFSELKLRLKAVIVHARIQWMLLGKSRILTYGKYLHIGKGSRLWAPDHINIGDCVYIGKEVCIEANVTLGDYVLIANRVGFVGRHDHDFSAIGYPVRLSPWVGDLDPGHPRRTEEVKVCDDVWIGYGSIIMTGVTVGTGAIVAAGSTVIKDVEAYSIVAGVPAKEVSKRFNKEEITEHERKIRAGKFSFSELGLSNSIIEPGS